MNLFNKNHFVSCSTQTNENSKKLKNNRIPSLKNIRLKIEEPLFNIKINNKASSQLKGKKVLKKRKIIDIYNNIYYNSNNGLSTEKKDNKKKNRIKYNKHNKGEIALSFGEKDSENKMNINDFDIIRKYNFKIIKKLPSNDLNNINDNVLYNTETYELPLYNLSKILKNKNRNNLFEHSNYYYEDIKTNNNNNINNINYKDRYKENFPIIVKNNFDSTDIRKENENIINDLFRRDCLNKKKISKKLIKINIFNKNSLNKQKNLNNYLSFGKKFFNNKDIIENSNIKMNTEINYIKHKVRQLYKFNHNKTSDHMALSNDY